METKGNRGEWSEIYALFRLLGEGKVHAGDAKLNKLKLFYPILNVIRQETIRHQQQGLFNYKLNKEQHLVIINENGSEYARIPMNDFMRESENLLNSIIDSHERAFPATERFMRKVGCTKLKATDGGKADIHIVIHDLRTNMTPLLGFSIKSQLGSPATLINAGQTTNISYQVCGGEMSDEDIAEINAIRGHLPRMAEIMKRGYTLRYHDVDNPTFKNNLLFLDMCMPEFIAACLICDSTPNSTSIISEAVEIVARNNPFSFTGKDVQAFYEHKMKVLLIDAALGMTPAKEWKGKYDANGGYLVVKENGDLVCYHFYNRNDVEDYLYYNTRFERGSRSRHRFGNLYRGNDGNVYIKLNLQVRFQK